MLVSNIFIFSPRKLGKIPIFTTLQGTNISPKNGILRMIFLFPRWDMLILRGVVFLIPISIFQIVAFQIWEGTIFQMGWNPPTRTSFLSWTATATVCWHLRSWWPCRRRERSSKSRGPGFVELPSRAPEKWWLEDIRLSYWEGLFLG